MDNASNNNTMMEAVEHTLRRRGIPFDRDGNRIWCVPASTNIWSLSCTHLFHEDVSPMSWILCVKRSSLSSRRILFYHQQSLYHKLQLNNIQRHSRRTWLAAVEVLCLPAMLQDNDVKNYRMLSKRVMRKVIGRVNYQMAMRNFRPFNSFRTARQGGHPPTSSGKFKIYLKST